MYVPPAHNVAVLGLSMPTHLSKNTSHLKLIFPKTKVQLAKELSDIGAMDQTISAGLGRGPLGQLGEL